MSRKGTARRADKFADQQHDEPISAGITSPSGRDTSPQSNTDNPKYTPEQLDRAESTLNRFYQWREDNIAAMTFAEVFALDKAARGQRVSARAIVEAIRAHDLADVDGKPSKPNNDYAPIVARVLIIEHPEVAPHMERRRSIYDVLLGC